MIPKYPNLGTVTQLLLTNFNLLDNMLLGDVMKYIYVIRCIVNNKVYVGQTRKFNSRVNAHRCSLRKGCGIQKLQSDWDILGEDAFEFVVLETCGDTDSNDREKFYIKKYNSVECGYNTSAGGIGQGNFGYLNGMYGRKHSTESIALMSKNRKGITVGVKNPNYGNHDTSKYTDEVRKRMSDAQKRRWQRYRECRNKS